MCFEHRTANAAGGQRAVPLCADREQRMQDLMNSKSWLRPGVTIGPTTVVDDSAGFGAFAPAWQITSRAAFMGVYRAPHWRRASGDHRYRGKSDYEIEVGSWRAGMGRRADINLADYKMMALQEPPVGTDANCVFVYFANAGDIGAPLPKSRAVSLVAV